MKTAPELIGFVLCMDWKDVSEYRYQPTRYTGPSVYALSDYYFCSPTKRQKLPAGFDWQLVETVDGRSVFKAAA